MNKPPFAYEAFKKSFATRLKESKSLLGQDGALAPLIKEFLEGALPGELDAHIEESQESSHKNGKLLNTLKTSLGNIQIHTPRDRNGTFEPEIIGKLRRSMDVDLDKQILALYVLGNSLGDFSDYLQQMYGIDVSTAPLAALQTRLYR